MDWMGEFTPEQWAIIGVVAGVATAVATAASALLAMVWRVADRQRAVWITYGASASWVDKDDPYSPPDVPVFPSAQASLANVGDAVALAVRVVGLGCNATLKGEERRVPGGTWQPAIELMPAMQPGHEVHLSITCDPSDWDEAQIAVVWTTRPAWIRQRRIELVPLREVVERPRYSRDDFDEESGQHVRRELPEPPHMPLPMKLRAQRGLAPTRWRWAQRRRLLRELSRL